MSATLTIVQAGPMMTLQDLGRPGRIGVGLSPGGAMDRQALIGGAALLGLAQPGAAIEMAGLGGQFRSNAPLRFALTGAVMTAQIDGRRLRWNATHTLMPGQTLSIGGAVAGTYGYLTPASGIAGPGLLGSHATHLSVGLGDKLHDGAVLTLGTDPQPDRTHCSLPSDDSLGGGVLRLMPGPQTAMFDAGTRARLAATAFTRSPRASRTGAPLVHDGDPFAAVGSASPVSDFVRAGDVQITGDGTPFVMMAECQTIGGYPRIGTVIGADMARAVQASLDAPLRFHWVTLAEADALHQSDAQVIAALRARVLPLLRDPADIPDLLSYQLIGGVTAGDELEPAP
ncbi:biotin-dependent carboxyltransferase family protein [Loktanella sp. M215]|uniref:5-oxoprolinase subunit C family protein n=1 Tax=Loktanella sp. M215 TaxID=2675431 RepID=UPI001F3EADC7|nr:biotin-dependent carboxyltransferase family protein [Loktanella sp. M215]MCF7700830.1 urea amidolyase [Loktanella sp. M215]